jgi:hypothetical protein
MKLFLIVLCSWTCCRHHLHIFTQKQNMWMRKYLKKSHSFLNVKIVSSNCFPYVVMFSKVTQSEIQYKAMSEERLSTIKIDLRKIGER